jgi:S-DNA-T family DNA segregation ATPase FtsK/SpoIIIE
VILDQWEAFLSSFTLERMQELREQIIKLLREGPSAGISLIIAGDRGLLGDRIAAFIETRYVLRLSDREDYRLTGIRPSTLPIAIPPGRAYFGDPVNEVQFGCIAPDPTGAAQSAALTELARELADQTQITARPFRIDFLPSAISIPTAMELPEALDIHATSMSVLVGVGGDELSRYHHDFSAGPGLLIAGLHRTGRSSALGVAAISLHRGNVPTLLISSKPTPASTIAARLGVPRLASTDQTAADALSAWVVKQPQCVLLIDDAHTVLGTALDDVLVHLVRQQPPGQLGIVVTTTIEELTTQLRGIAAEARRSKQAVLLSPTSSLDGNAVGVPIPRTMLGRTTPGRGMLLIDDEWVPIQIPDLGLPS